MDSSRAGGGGVGSEADAEPAGRVDWAAGDATSLGGVEDGKDAIAAQASDALGTTRSYAGTLRTSEGLGAWGAAVPPDAVIVTAGDVVEPCATLASSAVAATTGAVSVAASVSVAGTVTVAGAGSATVAGTATATVAGTVTAAGAGSAAEAAAEYAKP